MSYFNKGYKDGNNKKHDAPKSDGLFGTPIFQSEKNRNSQKSYETGYEKGNAKRRRNLNGLQRLLD